MHVVDINTRGKPTASEWGVGKITVESLKERSDFIGMETFYDVIYEKPTSSKE